MKDKENTLRWFCGVPLLLNPLIWTDLLSVLAIIWLVALFLMCVAQFVFGSGGLAPSHVTAAAIYATYLFVILLAVFFLTIVMFYPKGYVMLYRLEKSAIYMESMRGYVPNGGFFKAHPFAVGESFSPKRSVAKEVLWDDVRSFREIPSMKTIMLRGKIGSLGRIYCPDESAYKTALEFVRQKVEANA